MTGTPHHENAALNTDVELWRGTDPAGDYYADSVFLTEWGGIGFNVGGFVVTHTPEEWLALEYPRCAECGGRIGHIHWCTLGKPSRIARMRARLAAVLSGGAR